MFGVEGAQQAYGAEGVVTIKTIYDDRDRPREASFHDADDAVILHVILTWDDAEYLIKEESQCGDKPPFPIAEAVENAPVEEGAAARAVLAQLFAASKPMWTTTYRYDDRGRQIDRSGFAHKVHNFNLSHCSGGL